MSSHQLEIDELKIFESKNEALISFTQCLGDIMDNYINKNIKVNDTFYVLWRGNPEGKILVVKGWAEMAELYWAKKNFSHYGYAFMGPTGSSIIEKLKIALINEDDCLFLNYIPYVPPGNGSYSNDIMLTFRWIYTTVQEIMQPNVVVSFGYPAFYGITFGMSFIDYIDMVTADKFYQIDNYLYYPLDFEVNGKLIETKYSFSLHRKLNFLKTFYKNVSRSKKHAT